MGIARRRTRRSAKKRRWVIRGVVAVTAFLAVGVALTLPLRWFDPPTTAFMLQDDSGREPLLHEWQAWDQHGPRPKIEAW